MLPQNNKIWCYRMSANERKRKRPVPISWPSKVYGTFLGTSHTHRILVLQKATDIIMADVRIRNHCRLSPPLLLPAEDDH